MHCLLSEKTVFEMEENKITLRRWKIFFYLLFMQFHFYTLHLMNLNFKYLLALSSQIVLVGNQENNMLII